MAWVVLIVISFVALAPRVAAVGGYRMFFSGRSGMGHVIGDGGLLLDRPTRAGNLRIGDVITMRERGGPFVTHRVAAIRQGGGTTEIVTKGDANPNAEGWSVPATAMVERLDTAIPALGWPFRAISPRLITPLSLLCAGLYFSDGRWPRRLTTSKRRRHRAGHRGLLQTSHPDMTALGVPDPATVAAASRG